MTPDTQRQTEIPMHMVPPLAAPPRGTGSGEPAPVVGVRICGTVGGDEGNISMEILVNQSPTRSRKQTGLTADQHDYQELSGEVMEQIKLPIFRLAKQHIPQDAVDHGNPAEAYDHNQTACSGGCREEHPTAVADYGSVPVGVTEHVVSRSEPRIAGPRHPGHGGQSYTSLRSPADVAGV